MSENRQVQLTPEQIKMNNYVMAREIAAQCWCDPETSDIVMDTRLAEAFAKRLLLWINTVDQLHEVIRELDIDNHYFQKRPCATCRLVTKVIGKEFGCVRMRGKDES